MKGGPTLKALVGTVLGKRNAAAPPAEAEAPPSDPIGEPGFIDLLNALEEPALVIGDRRVIAANGAARALLGDHIEGADVRLAIRHPAAAEALTGPREAIDPDARTELVGLGDPESHWTMAVAALPGENRLVRLTDASGARAAERMRVDFVANASHELRTPLATVLGFVETLQDPEAGGDPETRARFLKIMGDEAIRMRQLVDDLMSLSRIEAERFAPLRDSVDLLPLIEEARDALALLIEANGATIEVEADEGGTIVQGDRTQLAQLLSNLLANALKYGRPGTPVTIRIRDGGGGMLQLSVIDEGEGIAPQHLPRLTERFYRIDAGRSRAVGGTGLGLSIAKHIALRHRGRLEIESIVGEGTTVRIELPRASALQ